MFCPSRSLLSVIFGCSLLLSACETPADGMKAKKDPVSLQKAETPKALSPLSGDADKIARLEQQLAALQQEVAANRPKIAKIDVMEQKFKDLSLGLDRIDATYNMKPAPVAVPTPVTAPVPAPLPVPAPPPAVPVKPVQKAEVAPPPKPAATKSPEKPIEAQKPPVSKPAASGQKIVQDLRIGEKKEYSRLVLDLGQSVKISYDIDNEEKILLVEIPGFEWKAAKTKTFPKSLLIASYQAESDASGSRLVVQLRGPAKIANYSTIDATGGKLPRAVLDVSPQ
ncbi:MAG: hypothetical protein DI586_08240 [Micavibrio aeruginosavorus]|uniref:AMIN domain-containing protein n=1 Tax=Micavibrio aeruginosavorus TaxID=349221 RepID=A0A2W5FI83_9BACT|nr:MAG: hypothetical protein DI586_08240 [Micavibrio aeruginosavorus]